MDVGSVQQAFGELMTASIMGSPSGSPVELSAGVVERLAKPDTHFVEDIDRARAAIEAHQSIGGRDWLQEWLMFQDVIAQRERELRERQLAGAPS